MPLDRELMFEPMRYACPRCGVVHEGNGSWFTALQRFRCAACSGVSRFGYSDKLKLFEETARKGFQRLAG